MNSDAELISSCDIRDREKCISCTKRVIFNNEREWGHGSSVSAAESGTATSRSGRFSKGSDFSEGDVPYSIKHKVQVKLSQNYAL